MCGCSCCWLCVHHRGFAAKFEEQMRGTHEEILQRLSRTREVRATMTASEAPATTSAIFKALATEYMRP